MANRMVRMTIDFGSELSETQRTAVQALCAQATHADQVRPLNEAALLAVDGSSAAEHGLLSAEYQPNLLGYAQFDGRDVQLLIAPAYRGQGLGRELAHAVQRRWQPQGWWSFGTLAPAARLAERLELRAVRELAKMTMTLTEVPPMPDFGADFELTTFTEEDLAALVAVNARAFATHPEQGQMDVADARRRMAQDWFEPSDLLLLRTNDGQLAGFHWTKLEADIGEVYVIAVDPDFAGQGLGRQLLNAGLRHLQQRDARVVELYVEKNNTQVVRLYQTSGFQITNLDTNYAPMSYDQPRQSTN